MIEFQVFNSPTLIPSPHPICFTSVVYKIVTDRVSCMLLYMFCHLVLVQSDTSFCHCHCGPKNLYHGPPTAPSGSASLLLSCVYQSFQLPPKSPSFSSGLVTYWQFLSLNLSAAPPQRCPQAIT